MRIYVHVHICPAMHMYIYMYTRVYASTYLHMYDGSPKGRVILSFVVDSTTHKPVKVFTTCRHNG